MGFEHIESALDGGEVAIVARPVVARPFALEVSSKRRPVEGSKLERGGDLRRHVGTVDRGEHVDAGVGDDRSLVPGELGDPAAPGVGQVVGRRDSVHPIHHDERIAEWRRVWFEPEHLGDGDRRPAADCLHGGCLPAEVVGGEDRPGVDGRGEPHGDAPIVSLTAGGPRQFRPAACRSRGRPCRERRARPRPATRRLRSRRAATRRVGPRCCRDLASTSWASRTGLRRS